MKENRVTIDELAVMIKRGFDETAKKVDMDARFDELEKRFDGKLETVKKELQEDIAHVNRLPSVLVQRIDHMEDDIRLIKTKVGMR